MTQTHKVCTTCGYVGKAIFLITKFSSVKCPKCQALAMMPLRSPEGQAILGQSKGLPRPWNDSASLIG